MKCCFMSPEHTCTVPDVGVRDLTLRFVMSVLGLKYIISRNLTALAKESILNQSRRFLEDGADLKRKK